MGPDDLTVAGLARLEAEVLRPHPGVLSSIEAIVADFTPVATAIAARHSGPELMAPVQARRTQDWRSSPNFALAILSFLLVLLPALALGISLRPIGGFENVVWAVALLVAGAALICVIKLLSTLRDRVWVGVIPRWAIGAAAVATITTVWMSYVGTQVPGHDAGTPLAILAASTVVVVAFAVLAIVRQKSASLTLAADLADIQPEIDAYLGEFGPEYDRALVRIRKEIETIDSNTRLRLKRERDGVIAHLSGNRGLYRGRVPLFMNKKELGELTLSAAAEPLLGGGPYPVISRPAKSWLSP